MNARLTSQVIDYHELVESVRGPSRGAVVLFLGTVRELSEGRAVHSLDYEAYPVMAQKKLDDVLSEARGRWPIEELRVVHRVGHLDLGDIAVAVVAASGHRAEAFEAARWVMDTIKQVVPIWKREIWADGAADWIHPDGALPSNPGGQQA